MPIADGENLSPHIYQEREVNEGLKNDLVDVAQLTFSAEGLPEESDVREHLSSRSTLVVARDEDRPIGFGAVERVDNLVVQHGVAVRPENQGERLGSFLFDLATMLEAEHGETGEIPIGGRTQSPFYIRYIKSRGGYPRKNTQTPEELGDQIDLLARYYDDGEKTPRRHIIKVTYSGPLYVDDELRRYREYVSDHVTGDIDLSDGDGVLATARTTYGTLEHLLAGHGGRSAYPLQRIAEELKE